MMILEGNMRQRKWLLGLFVLFCIFLTSCSSSPSTATPDVFFSVSPQLREIYMVKGGPDRLGAPILSPVSLEESLCQYFENGLLCHNPLATGTTRFSFYPLGLTLLPQTDTPNLSIQAENSVMIDGYWVPAEFASLYDELGGRDVVGRPISNANNNFEQKRVEQYFENLGFYHRFDDPPGTVYLLPYGRMACKQCSPEGNQTPQNAIPQAGEIQQNNGPEEPFRYALERMGGAAVFGRALSSPYPTANGEVEQVYETVVVYAPAEDLSRVSLRPISRMLGMRTSPPTALNPNLSDITFFVVQSELGYHVPNIFANFLALHGGQEMSGLPICETTRYPEENNIIRQCFENYCLDYNAGAAPDLQVRLAPLGVRYLTQMQGNPTPEPTQTVDVVAVPVMQYALQINEAKPQVTSRDAQEVSAFVYDKNTEQPVSNLSLRLSIIYPDRQVYKYFMPATDSLGFSVLGIAPLPELANGSVVPYEVCVVNDKEEALVCAHDSYMIWN